VRSLPIVSNYKNVKIYIHANQPGDDIKEEVQKDLMSAGKDFKMNFNAYVIPQCEGKVIC
jgi:hypothetical protein